MHTAIYHLMEKQSELMIEFSLTSRHPCLRDIDLAYAAECSTSRTPQRISLANGDVLAVQGCLVPRSLKQSEHCEPRLISNEEETKMRRCRLHQYSVC